MPAVVGAALAAGIALFMLCIPALANPSGNAPGAEPPRGTDLPSIITAVAKQHRLDLIVGMPRGSRPSEFGHAVGDRDQDLAAIAQAVGGEVATHGRLTVIRPTRAGRVTPTGGTGMLPSGDGKLPISMQFRNAQVRDVLRVIQRHTGSNLLVHKAVFGYLTLVVQDVPAGELLDAVAIAAGLEVRSQGSIVFVGHPEQIAGMLPDAAPAAVGTATVSLDFADTAIAQVAKLIAQRAGHDFIVGGSVRGNVTVRLTDAGVFEAMQGIARANGFDARLVDRLWLLVEPRQLDRLQAAAGQPVRDPTARISLDFRETRITDILRVLAHRSQKALNLPPGFGSQLTTVRINDRPIEQVARLVAALADATATFSDTAIDVQLQP